MSLKWLTYHLENNTKSKDLYLRHYGQAEGLIREFFEEGELKDFQLDKTFKGRSRSVYHTKRVKRNRVRNFKRRYSGETDIEFKEFLLNKYVKRGTNGPFRCQCYFCKPPDFHEIDQKSHENISKILLEDTGERIHKLKL